jgi:hypothetical protein
MHGGDFLRSFFSKALTVQAAFVAAAIPLPSAAASFGHRICDELLPAVFVFAIGNTRGLAVYAHKPRS